MVHMQAKVYLDNASTTKINKEVLSSYQKLIATYFENSDALYDSGVFVKNLQENSRNAIASYFNVAANSVIFTSGASEANNMAIKGVALASKDKKHIITSSVEHASVLNSIKQLKNEFNYEVTILDVDSNGAINLNDLRKALRKDTCLVSIMYVNNEVGSINPIYEIANIVKKESNAYLHIDMVQALGKLEIILKDIDLATFSAHKIEGLKGSGLLIKKPHVNMIPLISGGQQEFGLRGGTSNALVNALFFKTMRLYLEDNKKIYIKELKEYLLEKLAEIDGILINTPKHSVDNIINFSYENIFSEVMMNALNLKGICVSAQSTCSSKSDNPSMVLKAMGFSDLRSKTCIRVSLSKHNTIEEIDYFIYSLKEIINKYGSL
ncbi:MAG: cysteine desulfurase [Erysipelotrichaceae bacterium]|nr:cysteine desulfurase [Erysipelotrichaceae bacterium]